MEKSGPSSLVARAILALFLMVGFYLLALAIAAGLILVVYIQISGQFFNVYIFLSSLLGAGVIIWSILPRADRFIIPGPRLEPAKHPRLFTELATAAKAVNQEMPSEVYLIPEINAWVAQRGGFLGLGSRRVMGIGLPLLQVLTVTQLKAVLTHEFGHYYSGDTKLGPLIYRTRNMVIRTVSGLNVNSSFIYLIRLPFTAYGKLFLRITQAISRRQEYSADELAAKAAGPQNMIAALRQIHGAAPAWEAYWRNEVAPIFGSGFVPPLADGFGQFMEAKQIAQKVSQIVEQEFKESKTNPYDSHPSLHDRVTALQALARGRETTGEPLAISLIENVSQLEVELLIPLSKRYHISDLKAISWNEVISRIYIPAWESTVSQQEYALRGLTPENLPIISRDINLFESRLLGGENLSAQQRTNLGFQTIGAALTLSLVKQGWTVHAPPGESIYLTLDRKTIETFDILPRLISNTLPADVWSSTCKGLGITGVDLAEVIPKKNTTINN